MDEKTPTPSACWPYPSDDFQNGTNALNTARIASTIGRLTSQPNPIAGPTAAQEKMAATNESDWIELTRRPVAKSGSTDCDLVPSRAGQSASWMPSGGARCLDGNVTLYLPICRLYQTDLPGSIETKLTNTSTRGTSECVAKSLNEATGTVRSSRPFGWLLRFCARVRREFRVFCENTTIRGVPRIAKAKSKPILSLWLTFVLLLFVGLFVCMFFLARQYLEYDVIHPPRVLRDANSPFPALTFCNLRPLKPAAKTFIQRSGWRDPRQFSQRLNEYAGELLFKANRKPDYQRMSVAISMGSYLASLGEQYYQEMGHTLNESIIQCQVRG
ncbi:unnamed protein product [Protopolystoma xenopodis]|uniref:Uncharacterized protein n=1 Tax=Protopolystoma xenopodis TaxID=117903 RepID=A0A448WAD7_9PLAT|nr:unnamed protein product [Protopolystoma xenopodis]